MEPQKQTFTLFPALPVSKQAALAMRTGGVAGRLITLAAAFLAAAAPASAREISADEAGRAAAAWMRRNPTPLETAIASSNVASVRAVASDDGTPLFHVVSMEGGGVVVTSAESGIEPVVAFLDADDIDDSPGSPLWEILNADLALRTEQVQSARAVASGTGSVRSATGARSAAAAADPGESPPPFDEAEAAWAELLDEESPAINIKMASNGISSISDVRVSPLVQSKWNQDEGSGASNYYTPPGSSGSSGNYVCGCVALAGAQIARYWEFPTASRPKVTRTCYVNNSSVSKTTMGGTYAWSSMPYTYSTSSMTTAQKQAIGKLCYDFGVAVYMNWGILSPDGSRVSGAPGYCLANAFKDVFGYANAIAYCGTQNSAFSKTIIQKSILSNLDARCPVSLGISGHQVVADGYGYSSSTLYTHINLGWGGGYDAWYNLPTINTWYDSSVLDIVVFNIFKDKTGDLLTGRVLNSSGTPVSGASVKAVNGSTTVTATTDSKGIYALWVTGGKSWAVTATSGGVSASKSVSVTASASTEISGLYYSPDTGTVGNSWGNDITLAAASVPSAPTNVSATDGSSTANCTVSWTASSGATSYTVYRNTSNATGSATALKSGVTTTSYSDTSATPGTLYYYWVKATGQGGTSGFSSGNSGYRKLSAPTISSASGSSTGVKLSWGAVSGATHYRVYRATSSTGTKTALGPWQTAHTYEDVSGTPGQPYFYYVQAAVDANGSRPSDFSQYVKTTYPITPAQPSLPPDISGGANGGGLSFSTAGGKTCLNMSFHGEKGFTYLVQHKERLSDPEWETVATISPDADGAVPVAIPIDPGATSSFYRIVTE